MACQCRRSVMAVAGASGASSAGDHCLLSPPCGSQWPAITATVRVTRRVPTIPPRVKGGNTAVEDLQDLLNKVSTFVFDCDGVIWSGSTPISGSVETLNMLRDMGKRIFFVTNNASKHRRTYLKKFHGMGIQCTEDQILTSAFAAAAYLKSKGFKKKVYVVGEQGLCDELKEVAGVETVGGPLHAGVSVDWDDEAPIHKEDGIGAVVVGFDKDFNYYKLCYAIECLRTEEDCQFIATNRDALSPISAKQILAGGGCLVSSVAWGSGREPMTIGKPNQFLLEHIMRSYNVEPEEMCMVGDRLDTDIEFGKGGGLRTLLVLSGITSPHILKESQTKPDLVVECLGSLKGMTLAQ